MGCGCGERAIRMVRLLGVEMEEDYVRKHHFRATLKAIWIRVKGSNAR
jgi:hypothetical protein